MENNFETRQISPEQIIGWKVATAGTKCRKIEENELHEIIQAGEKKIYRLKRIPKLSHEEALLLRAALEKYRIGHGSENDLEKFLRRQCEELFISVEPDQLGYLALVFAKMVSREGILSEFLLDGTLEEISVIGPGKPVWVFHPTHGWLETNISFSNEDEIRRSINSMAGTIGRRITIQNPVLNASLSDGSRLCASTRPVSHSMLTIRKFKNSEMTLKKLCEIGSADPRQIAFLSLALQSDCSALICGNTGSGKTTLLNMLCSVFPGSERIVAVEETPELEIMHPHFARLVVSDGIGAKMGNLISATLRMRPDRVIVGEMRTKDEVHAFIDTLLAGQGKGSYATFHAQSAREAVSRLCNLGANDYDVASVDIIITQKRWTQWGENGHFECRKMVEICEPEMAKNSLELRAVAGYSGTAGFFSDFSDSNAGRKIRAAFDFGKKRMLKEVDSRAEFIEHMKSKTLQECFNEIQGIRRNS